MVVAGRCRGCGAELGAGTAFCAHCGSPAGGGPATQAMPAPPLAGAPVAPTQAMPAVGPATVGPAPVATAPGAKAQSMTLMAGVALDMSTVFNAGFGRPFPGWRAELAEPVGPSTGGGKQSLQPITLIAPSGERLAVGKVDPVHRYAQVRDYQLVARMHQERFGRPLALALHDYNRWIEAVRSFFASSGLATSYEDASAVRDRPQARTSAGAPVLQWILLLLALAALVGAVVWYFTR